MPQLGAGVIRWTIQFAVPEGDCAIFISILRVVLTCSNYIFRRRNQVLITTGINALLTAPSASRHTPVAAAGPLEADAADVSCPLQEWSSGLPVWSTWELVNICWGQGPRYCLLRCQLEEWLARRLTISNNTDFNYD